MEIRPVRCRTIQLAGFGVARSRCWMFQADGDAVIFFPKNNVVHMGDDFVRYGFPFIDVANGVIIR